MSDIINLLTQGLHSLHINPEPVMLEQFHRYILETQKWCRRTRLVSNPETGELINRHILDSLAAIPFVQQGAPGSIVDLGSGAGFPGMCVAIAQPDVLLTLIEARQVRVEFLKTVVRVLSLNNCLVLNMRLDQKIKLPDHLSHNFNIVMARGFAPLAKTVALGYPFLNDAGRFVLHRGKMTAQERHNMEQLLAHFNLVEINPQICSDHAPGKMKTLWVAQKRS